LNGDVEKRFQGKKERAIIDHVIKMLKKKDRKLLKELLIQIREIEDYFINGVCR